MADTPSPTTPPGTPPPTTPPAPGQPTPTPSPEPGTPPGSPPAAGEGEGEKKESGAEKRIREALEAKSQAEQRVAELEREKSEREEAELSEKERAEKQRDDEKARADAAEAKATRLERQALVRTAAAAAAFADPEDAVAHLAARLEKDAPDSGDGAAIDTAAKAKAAVEKLLEARPHLKGGERPPGFGALAPAGAGNGTTEPAVDPDTGKVDEKLAAGQELAGVLGIGQRRR
jgi:hypothetical protein